MQPHSTSTKPRIGEGIYLAKDISAILNLDILKVNRWLTSYWNGSLGNGIKYTFGEKYKAVNFYSLIEFYTFYKLREKNVSVNQIKMLHDRLSELHNTPYPFAVSCDIFVSNTKKKNLLYYDHLGSLLDLNPKNQFSFSFLNQFLEKIEFDDDNIASRFFPLNKSKNIVVDPKRQFGQPIINGTNIRTNTIFNLYKGGERIEDICSLYDIQKAAVRDAIKYEKAA